MKIYLAGKIRKCCWRHDLVRGLDIGADDRTLPWPILEKAIFDRHDYVGPYFVGCDHGCYHGDNSHGVLEGDESACQSGDSHYIGDTTVRVMTVQKCLNAIRRADLVFAWIDDVTAHATLFEVGFALGIGKRVLIGTPIGAELKELWFMKHALSTVSASTPERALRTIA